MRLFMLRYGKGGSAVKGDGGEPLYFGSKPEAKQVRDTIGGNLVVSYGVDHKLYKGKR
jgi:hypothetical protein